MNLILRAVLLLLFMTSSSQAELFRNAYLSFEMPPNWKCNSEGTEWVCTSKFNPRAKEAIIILTAKESGPSDNLKAYEAYLKNTKTIKTKSGKTVKSHVYNTKKVKINNHMWIDSLQINSEVVDYYTRYLVTRKGKISVLVTFSAHKAHYTKYSADFFKAIMSLRVIPPKLNKGTNLRGQGGQIGGPLPTPVGSMGDIEGLDGPPDEAMGGLTEMEKNIAILAFLLASIGLYLLIRKRKKKNK